MKRKVNISEKLVKGVRYLDKDSNVSIGKLSRELDISWVTAKKLKEAHSLYPIETSSSALEGMVRKLYELFILRLPTIMISNEPINSVDREKKF